MLSASEIVLQPHTSLTAPKSKNISYSIQTVVPHCSSSSLPPPSSLGAGRILLVPPIHTSAEVAAPATTDRHSDLTSSLSLTQTSDVISRHGFDPKSLSVKDSNNSLICPLTQERTF